MSAPKTMKAARYRAETKKVAVEEIPVPKPQADEMLVKTLGSGLCHSDMMVIEGVAPFPIPDAVTIGHEAVGEVVELGRDAQSSGFKVGDKIGFLNSLRSCWKCDGCAQHYGFCSAGKFQMQGFVVDGFLQEYVIVDPNAAFQLPKGIDVVRSAPLCCAGITAYNGVKQSGLAKGQWLAVVGCGGLGQLAVRYAHALGIKVIAVDIDDKVLANAAKAGVEHTINSRSTADTPAKVRELTGGSGADAVVVFTAVKAGYDLAPRLVKVTGRVVVVGCPPDEIGFNAVQVALGAYSIHGASNHGTPQMLRECAEFTVENQISSPVRLFKIDQIGEMIDMMEGGRLEGNRLVVDFS